MGHLSNLFLPALSGGPVGLAGRPLVLTLPSSGSRKTQSSHLQQSMPVPQAQAWHHLPGPTAPARCVCSRERSAPQGSLLPGVSTVLGGSGGLSAACTPVRTRWGRHAAATAAVNRGGRQRWSGSHAAACGEVFNHRYTHVYVTPNQPDAGLWSSGCRILILPVIGQTTRRTQALRKPGFRSAVRADGSLPSPAAHAPSARFPSTPAGGSSDEPPARFPGLCPGKSMRKGPAHRPRPEREACGWLRADPVRV